MEAGPNTATSLSELAIVAPGFEGLESSWVQLLSHQAVLNQEQSVSAIMLQRTHAERHLTASEVSIECLEKISAGKLSLPLMLSMAVWKK